MKKINSILVLVITISLIMLSVGCEKEDPKVLSATPLSKDLTKDAGSFIVTITGNTDWIASSSESWCTVTPTSGKGNGTLTITYSANEEGDARNATITITGKLVPAISIAVTQEMGLINGVTYNNQFYPLTIGVIEYYGSPVGNPNYNFDVYLYHQTTSSFVGLYFWFWSSSSSDLVPGTYVFSSSGNALTFEECEFYLSIDDYGEWRCTSGTVTVEKIGNEYIFNANLNGFDYNEIYTGLTAYFRGNLNYIDDSKSVQKNLKRILNINQKQ